MRLDRRRSIDDIADYIFGAGYRPGAHQLRDDGTRSPRPSIVNPAAALPRVTSGSLIRPKR